MTVKEIAKSVNKGERIVQMWAKLISEKISSIGEKISLSSPAKPADYSIDEVCKIIEVGMGAEVAGVFRVNAVNSELSQQRKAKLPSGAQLREMRLGLPQIEFMKRIDFMIGFSSKAKHQEQIEVAPKEQGLLQFEEIKTKFTSSKN